MGHFIRISGWMNIVGAVLLLTSWLLLGLLNYTSIADGTFTPLFQGSANIVLLVSLFLSMLVLAGGFVGLFLFLGSYRIYAIVGFFSFLFGLMWFTAIQYYETFLLPYLAVQEVATFETILKGKDALVFAGFLASALPWTLGVVLFGAALLKCKALPRLASILWIGGGALQLFGALPIRTVGFLMLALALLAFGLRMRRAE